jgi:6-phosphogluconolactonase (cycloisomerase 2 family)
MKNRSPRLSPSLFFLLGAVFLAFAPPTRAGSLDFVEADVESHLSSVYDLRPSPDEAHLYAIGNTTNALVAFARNGASGGLTFLQVLVDGQGGVDGLRRPRQLAISPDGSTVYVVANQDDALSYFARDAGTGALTYGGALFNSPPDVDGLWQAKGVAVSAGGGYVLTSGRSDPSAPKGAVSVFSRDSGTGVPTFVAMYKDGTGGISGMGTGGRLSLSPDGSSVYVATGNTNTVVVFSFDEGTGALTWVETQTGIAGAADVAVSPDGSRAYVAGTNGITAFARDPGSGALTLLGTTTGTASTPGLAGVTMLAISGDGGYVYTSAATDNAVGALLADPAGPPVWFDSRVDNQGGVNGLAGASAVALTNDGYVYVGGPGDSAIAVFARGLALDFGDAPDPTFPTLLASDGARHVITPGFYLGSGVDAEADGAPSAAADGDDLAGFDDEDGVLFSGALVPGQSASVDITASAAGVIDAWVDFNGDGDWSDAGERIATAYPVSAGVNTLVFAVPPDTLPAAAVASRFRLSSAGVAGPGGLAADGEVEDYWVATGSGADLGVAASGTTVADWNQPFTFTMTVTNGGPNDIAGGTVTVVMNADAGAVTWTCAATNGTCTSGGSGEISDTIDLAAGGTLVYTISGTVPDQAPGPYATASATVAVPAGVIDPVASNDTAVQSSLIPSIFRDGFETGDTSRWTVAVP